jgi:ribosomal protein L22
VLANSLCAAAWAVLEGLVVSAHKVARHIRAVAVNWALAIMKNTAAHKAFLADLSRILARRCRKTNQKSKPILEKILSHALSRGTARKRLDLILA